ncbi:MAG: HEAT repeat domain-containing protein [Acidobacteriota bacterium]
MRKFHGIFLPIAILMSLLVGLPALGQARKPETRSVDGLIYDLKNPDAQKRIEAARLLGENEVRVAVPPLVEAAGDPNADMRLAVANALLRIGDTRGLPAFVKLARDQDRRVQRIAVQGIVGCYTADDTGFVSGVKKVVSFLNPLSTDYDSRVVEPYVPVSEDAVNALIDLLFNPDKGLRKDAAVGLGILRARAALPAIQDALNREDSSDVKVELIRAVYKIGDAQAAEMVVPFIRDSDKGVHDEAILTAGRLRVKSAVPVLNDLYRVGVEERRKIFGIVPVSGSDDLQRKVLEALAYIGDSSSRDIFEDALNDSRDEYRRYGAEGLGRMGDKKYETLLATRYLREEVPSVKLALGYALFLLGREEHIVEMVDNVEKDQEYYYLLDLPQDKIPMLYKQLQTGKDSVTIRLLDVIGLRGGSDALPVVQELTSSENADVASAANLAIRRLRARFPTA